MHRRVRRTLTTVLALAAAGAAVLAGPASAAQAAAHDPVVFVHGYWGDDWNWGVMVDRFRAAGWSDQELFVWDYDTSQSNVTTAGQLAGYVDGVLSGTGSSQVDIVTHSMGGLSSRHYLKFLGGTSTVDEWVSLGGPNHGTNAAYGCWDTSCYEMRYHSRFLTDLNAGDETSGTVRYGTIRSYCDEVINPDTSTILSGARNWELSDCVGHVSLLGSAEAFTLTRDFVR